MSCTLLVGSTYPRTVLHGTTRVSARAFLAGKPLAEGRRQRTLSEFGPDVLYVSEVGNHHQALMFASSGGKGYGGRVLLEMTLRPGARVLDLASDMVRRPAFDGVLGFARRPDFTDDMMSWLNEVRVSRGREPLSLDRLRRMLDPTAQGFDPIEYPTLLPSYVKARGFSAFRFTDETVLVDGGVIVGARILGARDVARLRAEPIRSARHPRWGLYAAGPEENPRRRT